MKEKKLLGTGISNFKDLIEYNYYYFDKTKYIEDICKNRGKTLLFTRPRRFGKTLNMSTLKYFFSLEKAEENKKLFKNLYISNSRYFSEQGLYPVIFISMKDIKESTWENCFKEIKLLIKGIYSDFEYVRDILNKSELKEFDKIWLDEENADYKNSLKNLCKYLYKYHSKKIVLLIDEYDTAIVNANVETYFDAEAKEFLKH